MTKKLNLSKIMEFLSINMNDHSFINDILSVAWARSFNFLRPRDLLFPREAFQLEPLARVTPAVKNRERFFLGKGFENSPAL